MADLINSPGQTEKAVAISTLHHHAPFASMVLRLLPLINDPWVVEPPFEPTNPDVIATALALDRKLPTEEELSDIRLRFDDALDGAPAGPEVLGALVPLLFAGRSTARPETVPARLVVLLEMLAFEMSVRPVTADVIALAVLNDLRTSRFAPEPAEMIAGIGKARRQIETCNDGYFELCRVRETVNDLLEDAGLRPPPPDPFAASAPAVIAPNATQRKSR